MFPNLKKRRTEHTQFENKVKQQLKFTLNIPNIKGRKNVNVISKDLVFWVARKQSLTKEIAFCTNCRFLLKYFQWKYSKIGNCNVVWEVII